MVFCLQLSCSGWVWGEEGTDDTGYHLLPEEETVLDDERGRPKPREEGRLFSTESCNVSLQQISACYYCAMKMTQSAVAWQSSCLFCEVMMVRSEHTDPPKSKGLLAWLLLRLERWSMNLVSRSIQPGGHGERIVVTRSELGRGGGQVLLTRAGRAWFDSVLPLSHRL